MFHPLALIDRLFVTKMRNPIWHCLAVINNNFYINYLPLIYHPQFGTRFEVKRFVAKAASNNIKTALATNLLNLLSPEVAPSLLDFTSVNAIVRKTRNPVTRRQILLVLLLVEVLTIRLLWSPSPEKRIAHRAFLTKKNDQYILAWRDGIGTVELVQMKSLPEILRWARGLQLSIGRNIDSGSSVENAWISDRSGSYVLLWKTENDPLCQMSFYRESDAQFFASAFRQGAYTRSILGHSVLMVGRR